MIVFMTDAGGKETFGFHFKRAAFSVQRLNFHFFRPFDLAPFSGNAQAAFHVGLGALGKSRLKD